MEEQFEVCCWMSKLQEKVWAMLHLTSSINGQLKTIYAAQKNTIHQVITMLATSKHVLFLGHNHLLLVSIGADYPTL